MQFKKTLVPLFILLVPFASNAQTTYLGQDAKENVLLERIEIKAKTDSVLNFSKDKPYSRKAVIPVIERYYSDSASNFKLSKVDLYNAQSALMNSSEWTNLQNFLKTPATSFRSKQA